jgi:hypothetical protein
LTVATPSSIVRYEAYSDQYQEVVVHSYTQDVPIDAAFYQRIVDRLGADPPPGLVAHLALRRPEGGLRYVDVWESQEACDRFVEERLHPVVHEMLREIFGDTPVPEPERVPMEVVHAWCRAGTWFAGPAAA